MASAPASQRLSRVCAHIGSRGRPPLQGFCAAAVTTPPWEFPPPADFPPPDPEPLDGPVVDDKVPVRTAVSADYQREYLLRCGVTEHDFGGALDPGMVASFAGRAIGVARAGPPLPASGSGTTSGGAFVSARWRLLNPAALRCDTPLIVTLGRGRTEPHHRGTMSHSDIVVSSEQGEALMEISNAGLALDAELVAASKKSASSKPAGDPKDGKTFVAAIQFTSAPCSSHPSTQQPNPHDLHISFPPEFSPAAVCVQAGHVRGVLLLHPEPNPQRDGDRARIRLPGANLGEPATA